MLLPQKDIDLCPSFCYLFQLFQFVQCTAVQAMEYQCFTESLSFLLFCCLSSSFARWQEEPSPTFPQRNNELIISLPLATVTSLGKSKSIDYLVRFCFTLSFNGFTGKSTPCLLCITKTMSDSGITGAANKISDEEEALGWSRKSIRSSSFLFLSICIVYISSYYIIIFLNQKTFFSSFFVYFYIYLFSFFSFFQDGLVYQPFIPI